MVRSRFRPLIAFAAVILAAGSVTAAGLTFTANTLSRTVAELPEVKTRVLPSYMVRLPQTEAAALDVSKTVEVSPKAPVAIAAVTTPATPAAETTLIAEVAPIPAATEPVAGDLYVVRSDVFVRSGPSKRYEQLGTVTGGTEVNVTDRQGGWLQVTYNGGSGWVYQRYLAPVRTEAVAEAQTGAAPF